MKIYDRFSQYLESACLRKRKLTEVEIANVNKIYHSVRCTYPYFDVYTKQSANIDNKQKYHVFSVVFGLFGNRNKPVFYFRKNAREKGDNITFHLYEPDYKVTGDVGFGIDVSSNSAFSDDLDSLIRIASDNYTFSKALKDGKNKFYFDAKEVGVLSQMNMHNNVSLNNILFGPPGTGKTYHTIETAVKAAEPTFIWTDRDELKAKYDALVNEKRIRFVTFHQSFGYEEFVEGIKPDVNDSESICYRVESGIFKQICEDASLSKLPDNSLINRDGRVWKISIEGAHQNKTKEYCLQENLAAIGWCDTGDLSVAEKNNYFEELGKNAQNSLLYFSQEMEEGDLVLCIDSATSIEAVGVVSGPYRFDSKGLPTGRSDYTHQRSVRWLQQGFSIDLKELNGNKRFSLPTCYPLDRLSVSDVLHHLEANNVLLPDVQQAAPKQNYVLVIDEINRGNISKIFGELITLIEPSKREGNDEALKLSLPYSGKPFSVPNNLYIIGTMNTADRSLTMLDTALRRRFDFVEMMPDPAILENAAVKGIDLTQLLTTLNQRIEVLYDREHTLGHAFLMPVKLIAESDSEDAAFDSLVSVFQNKIIPLLQEYFFEDWQKIRLVLGDNQKPKDLQFVTEETLTNQSLDALFGTGHGLNQYGDEQRRYTLQLFSESVWQDPQAYLSIYSKVESKKTESEMNQMPEGADAS